MYTFDSGLEIIHKKLELVKNNTASTWMNGIFLLLQVFPDDPEGIERLGYFFLAWFGLSVFLSLALPKWGPHFYIGSCLDWLG